MAAETGPGQGMLQPSAKVAQLKHVWIFGLNRTQGNFILIRAKSAVMTGNCGENFKDKKNKIFQIQAKIPAGTYQPTIEGMLPMRLKNRARNSTGDFRAAVNFNVQCREPALRFESAVVSEISPPPTTKRPRAIPRININNLVLMWENVVDKKMAKPCFIPFLPRIMPKFSRIVPFPKRRYPAGQENLASNT